MIDSVRLFLNISHFTLSSPMFEVELEVGDTVSCVLISFRC